MSAAARPLSIVAAAPEAIAHDRRLLLRKRSD